jgi:hypothetical protein
MRCATDCGSSRCLSTRTKTRLIEFGRQAAQNREKRGLGKPDTFKFLGFVLICGKSRLRCLPVRNARRYGWLT